MYNEFNQNDENQNTFDWNTTNGMPNPDKKSRKKMSRMTKKVGALVLSGAILGTTAGGVFAASTYVFPQNKAASQQTNTSKTVGTTLTTVTNNSSKTTTSGTSVQDIATKGMPSIVAITNKGVTETMTLWGKVQQPSESCGSGIIIGETDDELLVVTNNHVISGSQQLTVVFSYDESNKNPDAVQAHVKGYDSKKDLAVIAIAKKDLTQEMLNKISIAAVGKSSDLSLGEQVVAIGNALGYGQSVTTGIVSALDRQIGNGTTEESDGNTYIQTDAAINPGNSGGALFNMKGELVGINTAKIANEQIEGMGYAIPLSDVHDLIEDLMKQTTRTKKVDEKDRGYLNITGNVVSDEAIQNLNIPESVYVADVDPSGAAAKAGIKKGYYITKFDGKSVSSPSELADLVTYYKAGEKVTVTVQVPEDGEYKEKEIQVTLGKKIESDDDKTNNRNFSQDEQDGQQAPDESGNYFGEDPFSSFFGNPFA